MNTPFAHVILFCPGHAFVSSMCCCVDNLIVLICLPFVASVAWQLFFGFVCFSYSVHICIYIRYAYLCRHLVYEVPHTRFNYITLFDMTSRGNSVYISWHQFNKTIHTIWIMYCFTWHSKEIKRYILLHKLNKSRSCILKHFHYTSLTRKMHTINHVFLTITTNILTTTSDGVCKWIFHPSAWTKHTQWLSI
jgi:hypothetical protein